MVSKLAIQATLVLVTSYVLCKPAASGQSQKPVDVPCRRSWKAFCQDDSPISFSTDGSQLVTCGYDTVKFWDFSSGKELRRFDQEYRDGKARIWDEISPNQRRLIKEVPVDDYIPWYDDSPSAKKRRRDLRAGRHARMTLPLFLQAVLLADNHRVALLIDESFTVCPTQVLIYDLENGASRTVYTSGRKDSPTYHQTHGMVIAHNLGTLAYTDTTCLCLDVARTFNLASMRNNTRWDLCFYNIDALRTALRTTDKIDGLGFGELSFSPDDKIVANTAWTNAATKNRREYCGRITLWNVRTGERIARVHTEGRKVERATFAPNGRDLAVLGGTLKNTIFIASLGSRRIVRTLSAFQKKPGQGRTAILDYGYTPDGKFLVGAGSSGTAIFWDTSDYREVLYARLSRDSQVVKIAFTPDGKQLLAAFQDRNYHGMVKVWDMKDLIERMPSRNVPPPKIVPRVQPREKSRVTEGK